MIGVGVIGVGMVADIHSRALRDIQDIARVVAVYDRDTKRLNEFCSMRDLPPADSLESLLANPDVQAVIILTPPNVRRDLVAQAAAAGKHVLLEKPMERNTAGAEELAEIARAAGVTLGVVFQHRFRDASIKLTQLIRDNMFGELAGAKANVPWWRPQAYYDEPGRGTYARDGGGVLINQAIHTLDLLLSFTGPITSVTAMMGTTRLHRMEAEDFVVSGVKFASGAMGAITATTAAFPGGAESITLEFDQASAHLESGVLVITHHDGRTETFGEAAGTGGGADPMAFPHDWHASALRDFFEALHAGRQPAVNGDEALKVHRLIDAMTLSSREERTVKMDA
jgi:predicted dehydrogenase